MKKTLFFLTLFLTAYTGKSQIVIDTFFYTGTTETFIIDDCIGLIAFEIYAGSGGDANDAEGGNGGFTQGVMGFEPGDILYINVGAEGVSSSIGTEGVFVGSGGVYSYSECGLAGTGGGASDIRLNGELLEDRIIVAGGGGGAGGNDPNPLNGGAGGGLIGGDGVNWPDWPDAGGKGGTQDAGGTQGIACCECPDYTTGGTIGQGGAGSGDCAGGGGGGGGYFGGGGACFSGGGGGSSYVDPSADGITYTPGYQNGNGMIVLIYEATDVDLGITTISPIELMANADGATYQWIDCTDNSEIDGATDQNFIATENGDYAVIVTDGGCTDTSNCITISSVSLDENHLLNDITISPNPFDENFTISFDNKPANNTLVEIRDISGKVVYQNYVIEQIEEIHLEGESGTYFITVTTDESQKTQKIIKK